MGLVFSTVGSLVLALSPLGGPGSGRPQPPLFERASPSGAFLLHVERGGETVDDPGSIVLLREGGLVWSEPLPYAVTDAVVTDGGYVGTVAWPSGRPSLGACAGPSRRAPELVLRLQDPLGELLAEKRWVAARGDRVPLSATVQLCDRLDAVAFGGSDRPPSWLAGPDELGRFPRRGWSVTSFRGCEAAEDSSGPPVWSLHVRATPLRALAWCGTRGSRVVVVDRDFEPVFHRTFDDEVELRTQPGGALTVATATGAHHSFRFEQRDGWTWHEVAAPERETVEVELRVADATIELDTPPEHELWTWDTTTVTRAGHIVVVESEPQVLVYDASGALLREVSPFPFEVHHFIDMHLATTADGGFRVRWSGQRTRYLRYDASYQASAWEEPTEDASWTGEAWYPFGRAGDRWVIDDLGLRRVDGAGRTVVHVARMPDGRPWPYGRSFGVAPDGALAVLRSRPTPDLGVTDELHLLTPEGELRRTVTLPCRTDYRARQVVYDGRRAVANLVGERGILIVDTCDDSLRHIELCATAGSARERDLHFSPDATELWIVNRLTHTLLRYTLPD